MAGGIGAGGTLTDEVRLLRLFDEISDGLSRDPRRLPEKLFYDDRGARLFEQITRLDAYYPTRTEIGILRRCLDEVRELVGPSPTVVEFGTGSGRKTNMLLDALERPTTCVPIDISEAQLLRFADELQREYPDMAVMPLIADYTEPFALPMPTPSRHPPEGRTLFFFPGSSVGNFEPSQAASFLEQVGWAGGVGSSLLIGVDLVKEAPVLELAYDDPEGVTAEFNRNALRHLNHMFEGDIDPAAFAHRAVWNEADSRIEMRLVSQADQSFTLTPDLPDREPLRIDLRRGEEIVTEHSYKYHIEQFESLCRRAGWRAVRSWTDDRERFSVHYLEKEA